VHCTNCGAAVPDSGRFCPSCGRAIERSGDVTSLASGETHLADEGGPLADSGTRLVTPGGRGPAQDHVRSPNSSGWLSSSGSIDHGRFAPGTLLDNRYRIVGLLGRGGMGEVYRADDLRLGQPVALKFLPEALGRDPVRLAQFHNEVRTARQVSHANVCRVYDIGEIGDQLFLTMEYVDGEDLSSLLRRIGRLPEDKALEIARQICAGLAAAHERGVLHRDLKPANIMLDGAGRVRLMDFSLAAVGAVTDVRAGTPAYMAPEQLQGREVTVRSDIYALGLVLYELFTGRRVFDVKTLADLVARHDEGTITAPTEIVKTLEPAVESAILRCLNPDPTKRPPSALAVSSALPGGDPLAAALAAGETPSPEMVAAAGGEDATMSAAAGVVSLISVAVLLFLLAMLTDRTAILARVPLDKPQPVLVDRAAELARQFGYTGAVADSSSGYSFDSNYLSWAARHGAGAEHWKQLSVGQPAALRFWYRSSPSLLVPYHMDSSVSVSDPPPLTRGMVRVDLDSRGRMLWFEAVPLPARTAPLADSVNWDPLFVAAGFARARFTEATPRVLSRGVGTELKSWEGTLPDAPTMKVRIDAVGDRGRPTIFAILNEWDLAEGQSSNPGLNPVARTIGVLIIAAIPIGAALLARRNLRLGRGDRRGAFRMWAFGFGCCIVSWLVTPMHVAGLEEVDRMYAILGRFLYATGVLYVSYLALEPDVRRTWPRALVTWSRVLSGKLKDPFFGRDLVIATIAGLLISMTGPLFVLLPTLTGGAEPQPATTWLTPLQGVRSALGNLAGQPFNAMQNGLIVMLMLSLIRQGLRRLASLVPGAAGRVMGSTTVMWIVSIVIFVVVIKRNSVDAVYFWLDLSVAALLIFGIILVAFRYGLVALIWVFFVINLAGDVGLTLDGSKPYAGTAWSVAAILFGISVLGVWMARADQPMFGTAE